MRAIYMKFHESTFWLKPHYLLPLFSFLLLLTPHPLTDPDFGWHLRSGEIIITNLQIPDQDWFSFTMPNFSWVNHEWLQDTIVATLFSTLGFTGVRLWYACLGILFLVVVFPPSNFPTKDLSAISWFIGASLLIHLGEYRPQIVTAIFFALTYKIIFVGKTKYWQLPLLFFLWANLHAGFPIGFLLVLLGLFRNTVERTGKKDLVLLSIYFVLSIVVTFINPYGYLLYSEIFRTILDFNSHAYISEWQNFITGQPFKDELLIILMVLAGLFIYTTRKRITNTGKVIFGVFVVLSCLSRRNEIFLLAVLSIEFLKNKSLVNSISQRISKFFVNSLAFTAAILVFVVSLFTGFLTPNTLPPIIINRYPAQALKNTKVEIYRGNIFNSYHWGGFLLYAIPDIKTFIDGRMLHWSDKQGKIFEIYRSISQAKEGFEDKLDSYRIDTIIIQSNSPLSRALFNNPAKWKKIFGDDVSTVYIRVAK